MKNTEYTSGPSVAQRAPIYLDVNKDPRARNQAYLNQYASRVGTQVVAVDYLNGNLVGTSNLQSGIESAAGNTILSKPTDGSINNINDIYTTLASNVILFDTPGGLSYSWSGKDLTVTWTFDPSAGYNGLVTNFVVQLTPVGGDPYEFVVPVNAGSSSQKFTLTWNDNTAHFGGAFSFSNVTVYARDNLGHQSITATSSTTVTYQTLLPAPVITVTSVNQGYKVSWTDISTTQSTYNSIMIEEVLSTNGTTPNTGQSYNQIYAGAINPAVIITGDLGQRLVKARFVDTAGAYSQYSNVVAITPTPIVTVNTTVPDEVNTVSGTFANSGAGDDVIVTFTLPNTANYGNSFIVKLIPTTAPTKTGYFYYFPTSVSSNLTTSFTIPKASLYGQFGNYYSSYTGSVISVSSVGVRSTGTPFSQFTRTNPLTGVTPSFSVVPAANGYIVTWTDVVGETYADIYETATSWGSGNPTDESTRVYSGKSPITIQSLNYSTRYIKIRFYDDYGNASNYSVEQTVTPYDPGLLSIISNPVSFQTNGSILAGSYNSSTNSLNYPNVVFNTSGIFAYNSSGTPTTQIINTGTGNTFITQKAQIADWVITDNKIENTLNSLTGNTYTGLSGTGTYAMWAGASSTSSTGPTSDSQAAFWIKKDGSVKASNISITGGSLNVGGGTFVVNSNGSMVATSASITGNITAQGGSFTGNVLISGGSLYAPKTANTYPTANVPGVVFNSSGVAAYNSSGGVSQLLTTPLSDGSTFQTTAANIGGWVIDNTTIHSDDTYFKLDSSGKQLLIQSNGNSGLYYIKLSTGSHIFEAGVTGSNPDFYITNDGTVFAQNAQITGRLYGGGKTVSNIGDNTVTGYYLDGTTGKIAFTANTKQTGSERAYNQGQGIYINSYINPNTGIPYPGTIITGIPIQGNSFSIADAGVGNYYLGLYPFGSFARQRMVIEEPTTGQMQLGMGVYYSSSAELANHGVTAPQSGGYVGDLWVVY